ncbi:MAG: type II 3-dehydroquinate dehydratase [Gammaproteobacteria bacterium RIFCSPHIGHO2_12_FULL_40_19]|nr:MAG: type II 3-dehydroquinate dehydratase [Gammaproteobacteria bacterium RIFCSPHIGHO2_12_FULL_40_19]
MAKILILHGPNLNMLGTREPAHYGHDRLEDINKQLIQQGMALGHSVICFQSNAEHQLIDRIQQVPQEKIDFIIINPAAFTHTSIALRDAFLAAEIPLIEVHLSNVFKRESFRQTSFFSDIAVGTIGGFGANSYRLALLAAHDHLEKSLAHA